MKKIRFLVVMLCMAALMCGFAVTANAQSDEPIIEATPTPVVTTAPAPVPTPEPVLTPPGGTGTVVEQTDEEGKEFYTIMTADENVFYLVIDRQRETENVYFLNAVTEADLLPLVEMPAVEEPEPTPVPTPVPDTAPMPEIESGPDVRLLLILVLAEHSAELSDFRAAQAVVREILNGEKLLPMEELKEKRRKLAADKKRLYAEYRQAQNDMREAIAVKANIDHLLGNTADGRNKEQER